MKTRRTKKIVSLNMNVLFIKTLYSAMILTKYYIQHMQDTLTSNTHDGYQTVSWGIIFKWLKTMSSAHVRINLEINKKCLELHIKGDILNVISLVKEITRPINALVDEIKHQACWQTPDLRTENLGAVAGGC